MKWEKLKLITRSAEQGEKEKADASGPGKRWGHTCNAIRGGELLYVFGGYGKSNCQTNQVHVFDTARQTWSEPVIKGTPPSPRDSHSCTVVADNLFVFGGTDGMNPLKDLHILDTSSHTWISPSVRGEGPEAREGHSAALVGKELFIFGGCGKSSETSNEVYYNDVYILDTETFVWKRAPTSGNPPSARDSHTCSSWKHNIIVIGGEDESGSYLSDVYILETETLTWRVLETSGKLPPRAGHSTVAFGKNLFVFGGFTDDRNLYDDLHMLDVETGLWAKVTATGDDPCARFSVAGDSLDPHNGGVLVFIGGCNMHLEPLDDMLFLYTGLASENRATDGQYTQRVEKLSMRKQLRLKSQEQQHSASVHDKTFPNIGKNVNPCQPIPVPIYGQQIWVHVDLDGSLQAGEVSNEGENTATADDHGHSPSLGRPNFPLDGSQHPQGKRTFHAKVTDIVQGGFTIETTIDGMLLRGVVFSNKNSSSQPANENSSRKRAPEAVGGVKLNYDHNSKSNTDIPLGQNALDCKQADGVHGKEYAPHDRQTDTVAASILQNLAPSDATHPHEVPGNLNPSVAPGVNLDDDVVMHDAPNSSTEVGGENMTATTKDSAIFVPNQDGAEPTTSEHNLRANQFGTEG